MSRPDATARASARTRSTAGGGADRRRALAVLLLASTLSVMAGAIVAPIVAVIRTDLGLTDTAAGLVLTAHGVSLAAASPLIGRAIDRWGPRGPLAAGLAIYGLAGGAGLVLGDYAALIGSRLVFGVGAAAVFTATTVLLLQLYVGAERDRAMGWRSSAISVGGLAWPLAGGALGSLSWHAPFAVYLVGVPLAVVALLTLPARSGPDVGDHVGDGTGRAGTVLALLRARPGLLRCYALQGLSALLLYVMLVFVPLRLAEIGATAPLLAAACNCALSGVMAMIGLAYAALRARASGGDATLVRAALGAWIGAFALAAVVRHPVGLMAASALFGLGMGVAVPALTVLVAEAASTADLGRATSLSATATFVVQPLSPLLFGPLVEATSIPAGFLVAAGVAALALVLAGRRAGPRRRASPVGVGGGG